ncbi:MAG: putative transposase [Candidatus Paceibacterota bacterium]
MPAQRDSEFVDAAEYFGIAASWIEERTAASRRELPATPIRFQHCQALAYGGVLLLIPSLIGCGLMSYKKHYCELDKGYYYIDFIILLIGFMYLCRIKNPEQLSRINPGEFGRLLGIDRVPESKCLRKKIKQICEQEKSGEWNTTLAKEWVAEEDNEFYYIDGHIQIYHGHKAQLGKKYIARQKLCLAGVQEFWVNNMEGMPYFYIRGQVNEKLLEMLETKIIPVLLEQMPQKYSEAELNTDPDLPRFTIVFDREAYSPAFFGRLWEEHRIAVITYRKNVKDKWEETCFQEYTIDIEGNDTEMSLAEKAVKIKDIPFREVRKLSTGGHQTSVLTTHRKTGLVLIAVYMFARWTQENYFRYMRQDYDFDKMLQYTVEQIDGNIQVNHPRYSKLTNSIKKVREKISRREANLYNLMEENISEELTDSRKNEAKQQIIRQEVEELKQQEQTLVDERKQYPSKIRIKDMPDNIRYNQLHGESKHFHNIIKMICYRAETVFANLLAPHYKKAENEKRALTKKIINTQIDLKPDYETKKLYVTLYTLPSPKENEALHEILKTLNDSKTKYPGTDLILCYETTSMPFT